MAFRQPSLITGDSIHTEYLKVAQSNTNYFLLPRLLIEIDALKLPQGGAIVKLSTPELSYRPLINRKYTIIKSELYMEENSKLCFLTSVVLGIFIECNKHFPKRKTGDDMRFFKEEIRKEMVYLCRISDVNFFELQGLVSTREIHELQKILISYVTRAQVENTRLDRSQYVPRNFRIVIYNINGNVVFQGNGYRSDAKNVVNLNLLLHNDHFDLIKSLSGAFNRSYDCSYCMQRQGRSIVHKKCDYTCSQCFKKPHCDTSQNKVFCATCRRYFFGENCLKNHKKSVCAAIRHCKNCDQVITKANKHICGTSYCSQCCAVKPFDHLCYVPKYVPKAQRKHKPKRRNVTVYYDFETLGKKDELVDGLIQIPNLCVSQITCDACRNVESSENTCEICGERQKIFERRERSHQYDVVEQFIEYLIQLSKKFSVCCIAHNGAKFDTIIILKYLYTILKETRLNVVFNGTACLMLDYLSIRFIDSFAFLQTPLSKLPEMLNLQTQAKGYFPHAFNTFENQSYEGEFPDAKCYCPDQMSESARKVFFKWYEENRHNIFNFKNELKKYCIQDVHILRIACEKFATECFRDTGIFVFLESFTAAGYVNRVLRSKFYRNDMAILGHGGFRMRDKQSKIGIIFLLWQEKVYGCKIESAFRKCEKIIRIGAKAFKVDGYFERLEDGKLIKYVFEFQGCFYHSCESCFPYKEINSLDNIESNKNIRRESDAIKIESLKKAGYKVIVKKECEFYRERMNDENLKKFCKEAEKIVKTKVLTLGDAFFGGRTDTTALYYSCKPGEKIFAKDFRSLYPYCNKACKNPVGHPTRILIGDECSQIDRKTFEGFILCKVLPPTRLFHPVLPARINKKLIFTLCRVCAEQNNQDHDCTHNVEERSLTGTYVMDEMREAERLGYKVLEIYEMAEFQVVSDYFAPFVKHFEVAKLYATGMPSGYTEETLDEFIDLYKSHENIDLDKTKFKKNAALRSLSKLMLNSMWGRLGMTEKSKTQIVNNEKSFVELVSNSDNEITGIHILNENALLVSYNERHAKVSNTTNVAIAAYTTAQARLMLNNLLQTLGSSVLYHDTDSIYYVSNTNSTTSQNDPEPDILKEGIFLGQLSNELEAYGKDAYISEFCSGGPKNYGYCIRNDQEIIKKVVKLKGVTLNYENSKKIDFEAMKNQILNRNDPNLEGLSANCVQFVRSRDAEIRIVEREKKYSVVIDKRRIVNNRTYPFGYQLTPEEKIAP